MQSANGLESGDRVEVQHQFDVRKALVGKEPDEQLDVKPSLSTWIL